MEIKDGSKPDPAIQFTNDSNTGIYGDWGHIKIGVITEREAILEAVRDIENEARNKPDDL